MTKAKEFTPKLEKLLLERIRETLPSAEWAPDEAYGLSKNLDFESDCGCYSEWTTESCRLSIWIRGTLPEDQDSQYKLRREIEEDVHSWAEDRLRWNGCDCCGQALYISANIFAKKEAASE